MRRMTLAVETSQCSVGPAVLRVMAVRDPNRHPRRSSQPQNQSAEMMHMAVDDLIVSATPASGRNEGQTRGLDRKGQRKTREPYFSKSSAYSPISGPNRQ